MHVIHRVPAILGDRLLQDFERSLQAADLAAATRRRYAADLGRFRAWMEHGHGGPGVGLRRINTVDLANYRQHLIRSEKLRAANVNRKVQALKKFFAWAQQRKLIPANPAAALRFLRRQKRAQPKGLREGEIQALLRRPARRAMGWRGATTPSSKCCCKPVCAWARLRGW